MRLKVLFVLGAAIFLPALVLGGELTKVVSFGEQELSFSKVDGYDLVKLGDHPLLGEPGEPLLPVVSFKLVLPPSAEIVELEVISTDIIELPGEYLIHPAQKPRPISSQEPPGFIGPDEKIYSSPSAFPEEIATRFSTGSMGGYRIGSVELYPLRYVPSERALKLHTKIELKVVYQEGVVSPKPRTERQIGVFSERLKGMVANPEDLLRWAPPLRSQPGRSFLLPADTVEYVIITTATYEPVFQQLADWKTKKGVPARIVRLSDISGYPGRDTEERMRNFIIDAESTWGTVWFLLGGDPSNSVVPTRLTTDFGFGPYSDLASDWYFADLDGDWDANGNSVFGEMGDQVDMYSDVMVGRASVGSAAEAQKFVDKVLTYEKNAPTAYLKKELHSAEELWPGYGGWIVCDSIAGVTPPDYTIAKLYQYLGNLNAQAVLDSIDAGYQFVHFSAHGNTDVISTGMDAIYSWMVDGLTNGDKVGIHAAISCIVGELDYEDCIVEHFMNNLNGGTIGWLGNSRYGWGSPPDLFASELLDLRFFDYLFNSNLFHMANSHAAAKDLYVPNAVGDQYWRYCLYEWNLFGDPELPIWTDIPGTLTVSHPPVVPVGPYDLTVTVYDGATPVEDALVCVMDTLDLYVTGYTNPSGQVVLHLVTPQPETLYVTATAHNFWPYEGYILVEAAGPYVTYLRHIVDDGAGGNGDGMVNPGETIELPLWVRNWGGQAADGVSGSLARSDSFITAAWDTLKLFGSIASQDSAYTGPDGYNFTVSTATPDEHRLRFNLTCKDVNDSTWLSSFYVPVAAPIISYLSHVVSDPAPGGNGNGVAEPGETVDIEVTLENTGHADAINVQADLGTADPYITINTSHASYGDIGAGSSGVSSSPYNISIDPGCPDPHFPLFDLDITASGGYVWTDSFTIVVGTTGFFDDIESGQGDWSHYPGTPGYTDEWHITEFRNHSPTHSWKCGSWVDPGQYADYDDACLETEDITLAPGSVLRFWHWISAEIESPTLAWDGGIVQISTNGGVSWELIYPVGGYPYTLIANPAHPFPGLPCFSGFSTEWVEEEFDLSAYSGRVRIRFRFGSDGYTTYEGWYVDDIWVGVPTGVEELTAQKPSLTKFELSQSYPNPFSQFTVISYELPVPRHTTLKIYDLGGRLVRTLVDGEQGPGSYSVLWDGKDSSQREVSAGFYFYRLTARHKEGQFEAARKLLLMK